MSDKWAAMMADQLGPVSIRALTSHPNPEYLADDTGMRTWQFLDRLGFCQRRDEMKLTAKGRRIRAFLLTPEPKS